MWKLFANSRNRNTENIKFYELIAESCTSKSDQQYESKLKRLIESKHVESFQRLHHNPIVRLIESFFRFSTLSLQLSRD